MTRFAENPHPPGRPASADTASVLDRILAILDAVEASDEAISITELSLRTDLPKSTVSRLTTALIEQHYLERVEGGVSLGLRLFELGTRARLPRRLRAAAAGIIHDLGGATGERIGLWVRSGDDMVSIATLPGRLPMLSTRAGMRSPALTTASGKAFLAFCDRDIVDSISARLVEDAATRFRSELREVRDSSIASDPGVAYPGIVALASPVLSSHGTVIGALSIAGPDGSMDVDRVGPLVRSAGVDLSRRLAAA